MWRCVNDIFGYCKSEPDWGKTPGNVYQRDKPGIPITDFKVGGTCKNNPRTCTEYRTAADIINPKPNKAGSQSPVLDREPV